MTISPPRELLVAPRYRHVPPAPASAGPEAVQLAESAGLYLDDWQAEALNDALGERDDGLWAASDVGIIVPRQNGKGSILEARELAGLFLFGEKLILHSAHEYKTAAEAFLRIRFLIENTDDLRRRCKRPRTSHGEEGIELLNGNRLRFVARTSGSGRGFTGDCIILDEAYRLPGSALSALMPAMAAVANPQLWYTSSAPLPIPESDVLRRLCKRGRSGADARLAYVEYCAAPNAGLEDREAWADANPGIGIRIHEDRIERELAGMEPEDFARERLGLYPELDDDPDRVIPRTAWEAAVRTDSTLNDPLALAIDASPDLKSASIAASDGTHVEVLDHRAGSSWVVARLLELVERWHPGIIVLDPRSPIGALKDDLAAAGLVDVADATPGTVGIRFVTGPELSQACGAFLAAVTHRSEQPDNPERLRHLDQPGLNAAVANAARRPHLDAWAWSRRNASVDISPLVAVTLARWGHQHIPATVAAGYYGGVQGDQEEEI